MSRGALSLRFATEIAPRDTHGRLHQAFLLQVGGRLPPSAPRFRFASGRQLSGGTRYAALRRAPAELPPTSLIGAFLKMGASRLPLGHLPRCEGCPGAGGSRFSGPPTLCASGWNGGRAHRTSRQTLPALSGPEVLCDGGPKGGEPPKTATPATLPSVLGGSPPFGHAYHRT